MEDKLKKTVKKLFKEKKIDLFIGYAQGTLPFRTTPCFIEKEEEVEKLVWNSFCKNNLAVYLPRFFSFPKEKKKIGILAKGCDGRSIVELIKEQQIERENLVIVAINCPGMIDLKKLPLEVSEKIKEEKKYFADNCQECEYPQPLIYDILLEEKEKKKEKAPSLKELEKMSLKERWEYLKKEVSKCIRCYACRAACPNCYCKECFMERTRPRWVGTTLDLSELTFFHLGRIFHQAGRCTDCGACRNACPMNVDLRIFNLNLSSQVKELFKYQAGISLEDLPPLATFKEEDPEEFIIKK